MVKQLVQIYFGGSAARNVGRSIGCWNERSPRCVSTSIPPPSPKSGAHKSDVGLQTCRKLCEAGPVKEAFDALKLLVHQGYHIPSELYYRVLKRCMLQKDLVQGRRLHELTIQSGYDGNVFLTNHLILMYASCGRLEEAMQAFSKVSTPDVYMWASIIRAYAMHGKPAHAIRMYRQMRESTLNPDNRIFVAVLKACASAGDLNAGKDVHAHILACVGKLDIYVQNSLVHMYAKCGSLEDAEGIFQCLSQKTVVTWNSMISGYVQQGKDEKALDLYNCMQEEGLIDPSSVTFACLLQACAGLGVGSLHQGKLLHVQIEQLGLQTDVGGSLVTMYAKCGSLDEARRVFDRLPRKDVVTWNAMIAGYTQQGMGQEAVSLHSSMEHEGFASPDSFTFVSVLQACGIMGVPALHQGQRLHAQIKARGLLSHVVVGTSLVNMYAKCGSLEDAQKLFDTLSQKNVVTWNVMIAGYAHQGMVQKALHLYRTMQQGAVITPPDSFTFTCLLLACANVGGAALPQGKQLQAEIEDQGLQHDVAVGNSLINMYAKCGSLQNAQRVFDALPQKNVVTWTSMIAGYAHQGMCEAALILYSCMQQESISPPNSVTFVCLLQACASVSALKLGKQIHANIAEHGLGDEVVVGNNLVDMYVKCGSLDDARRVFDRLPCRDVGTWNTMIAGYASYAMGQEALNLYSGMRQQAITEPDAITFVHLLQACTSIGVSGARWGRRFHVQIEEQGLQGDTFVVNSLIHMYATCGSLEEAQRVFHSFSKWDVVTWNAMISGYVQHGMGQKALSLYTRMQLEGIIDPNAVTCISLLQACACVGVGALHHGKQLHAHIEQLGVQAELVVGTSLVSMYAKCGSLEDAQSVFDSLAHRNVVTWNAIIAGYTQQGMAPEALNLYSRMEHEGITQPDSVTFVCLLQACSAIVALPLGKYIHGQIEQRGLQADIAVCSSLVNMYAKCGSLEDAQEVFDALPERRIEAWGALMAGYARRGNSGVVFDLFDRIRLEGVQPDSIMFLSLLTVCSHVGLVDEGRKYFEAMSTEYGISASFVHYACMTDLLGRAGYLDEALQMVISMPFEPNAAVWLTLLGACQKWSNIEVAQQAFEFAVRLDDQPAAFVLMANIYADAQMWDELKEIQARRKKSSARKELGQSWWTDNDGAVHRFVVRGTHYQVEESEALHTAP